MQRFHIADIKRFLDQCAQAGCSCKEQLTKIDSLNGDGDLGVSVEKGMLALRAQIAEYTGATVGTLFMQCGTAFNKAAPSTMGTLIGLSLMALGKSWSDYAELNENDVVEAARLIADTMAKFGHSKPGDKTILDALYPFADAIENAYEHGEPLCTAFEKGKQAARNGMECTKSMMATVGRARWLGERATGVYDGGAMLCVSILESITL